MFAEKLVTFFLPAGVRHNKTHPDFYDMYAVASANIVGSVALSFVPLVLLYFDVGSRYWSYYLGVATYILTLFSLRLFGHWRIPTYLCAAVMYYIVYSWLENTGLIYSTNTAMVYLYLIGAVVVDRVYGWYAIFTNLAFLGLIYYLTVSGPVEGRLHASLGSPLYALLIHVVMTAFIGGFLAYNLRDQEANRRRIKALQDQKISLLDEAVRTRTEQLNNMRQTIATDFHDHTGNMLAAISRQASTLEMKLHGSPELLPIVKSIALNSNELYASSKDFLWNLNNDSDNPLTLFHYLTAYGQAFYNQFDISFSSEICDGSQVCDGERAISRATQQLSPFAALNLIYIFKEAMSNVVKHSGADEVKMLMRHAGEEVVYMLADNGRWKQASGDVAHYGLDNMQRRCTQSGFGYELTHGDGGTRVSVSLPLYTYLIQNEAL